VCRVSVERDFIFQINPSLFIIIIVVIIIIIPMGRPRRRWEDNIKMDLQEVLGKYGAWIELAQDRDRWRALVSTVKNIRVP
jgi:hypothetical protein